MADLGQGCLGGAELGLSSSQLRLDLLAAGPDAFQLLQVPAAPGLRLRQHGLHARGMTCWTWPRAVRGNTLTVSLQMLQPGSP